jgi:ketosteroid isomerase-like protein
MPSELRALAQAYLAAIERGATGSELAAFFAPEAVQEEFPNRLVPTGARRDLNAILEGALRGHTVLRSQRYEILGCVEARDEVALEVQWRGVLAIPIGTLAAGAEMRARFAVFLEFRAGKIARQRNYDCFDPW